MGGGGEESVVCPKPRRLGIFNPSVPDHVRPCRWSEIADSKSGTELLDIILAKGGYGSEKAGSSQVVAFSPPYFCGSPPVRASNPVIQDAQFNSEKQGPPSSSSSSSRIGGGGCVRMNYGHKPAAVRIEGFDCLSRDRRNCSISAVA